VLVGARHHVGAAAHHRLERARAAGEIADAQAGQPLVLEVAQALAQHERQVVERRLAADSDVHVGLLDLLRVRLRCENQRGDDGGEPHEVLLLMDFEKSY
jgi:hypothetical protein